MAGRGTRAAALLLVLALAAVQASARRHASPLLVASNAKRSAFERWQHKQLRELTVAQYNYPTSEAHGAVADGQSPRSYRVMNQHSLTILFVLLLWRSYVLYKLVDQFIWPAMRLGSITAVLLLFSMNLATMVATFLNPVKYKGVAKAALLGNVGVEVVGVLYNLLMLAFSRAKWVDPETYFGQLIGNLLFGMTWMSLLRVWWMVHAPPQVQGSAQSRRSRVQF